MITKEEEYIAEVCKISGFAFIAPLGKVFLSIPYIELSKMTISHMLYIIVIFLLACIGITMIFNGKEILREKRN